MPRMDGASLAAFASLWVPCVCGEVTAQVRTWCGGGMGGQWTRWVMWHAVEPTARAYKVPRALLALPWVPWRCARVTVVVREGCSEWVGRGVTWRPSSSL